MNIEVFKQNSIKIDNIYVDPYGVDNNYNDAKYIFITHNHYDHYSLEDINKVVNSNTIFIIPLSMKNDYKFDNEVIYVEPNKEYNIDNINFKTFRMYNINKPFHKYEDNWCGYHINYNNTNYLVLGDTDYTDDIIIDTDIVFVPIGGTYTMDVNDAIDYLSKIKYELVIPVHYGSIIGDNNLGNILKNKLNNKCIIKIK